MRFPKTKIFQKIPAENSADICELLESLKFPLTLSVKGETDAHSHARIEMVLAEVWEKSKRDPEIFAIFFADFCRTLLNENRKNLTALLLAVAIGNGYLHEDLIHGLERELAQKIRTILDRERQKSSSILQQVAEIWEPETLFVA